MKFIRLEKIVYYSGAKAGPVYINPDLICYMETVEYVVKATTFDGLRPGETCKYTLITFPGGGDENNNMTTVWETPEQIITLIGASE